VTKIPSRASPAALAHGGETDIQADAQGGAQSSQDVCPCYEWSPSKRFGQSKTCPFQAIFKAASVANRGAVWRSVADLNQYGSAIFTICKPTPIILGGLPRSTAEFHQPDCWSFRDYAPPLPLATRSIAQLIAKALFHPTSFLSPLASMGDFAI
jgi:hypothetical protein